MSAEPAHRHSAYGLIWGSDRPLAQFRPAPRDADVHVDVHIAQIDHLPPRDVVQPINSGALYTDGTRFAWQDELVFDMRGGVAVNYCPGPQWQGVIPHAFYGTMVAQVMAWRGQLPMHACAVGVDGHGVLILGPSGAGKSSLTAGLLAAGAELLSDDLSLIAMDGDQISGAITHILPGRTTIRLSPHIADLTGGERVATAQPDPRGKVMVRISPAQPPAPLPLRAMLMLAPGRGPIPLVDRAHGLRAHVFRPHWLSHLPGHEARQRACLRLAAQIPMLRFSPIDGGGDAVHVSRARDAIALIRAQIGSPLPAPPQTIFR